MIPYIDIYSIKLPVYHLLMLLSFIFSGLYLRRIFKKLNFNRYLYMIVIAISIIFGLLGSHILSIIETESYQKIFSANIFLSGMNFLGGLIFSLLIILILLRFYRKISFTELFAACSPSIFLGYGIGRIGCFLSGDGCYGIPTNLPWGLSFPNGIVPTYQKVHPTPLYESIICLVLFFILLKNINYNKFDLIKYKIIAITLFGLGLERFLIEFLRRNTHFCGLSQAQWISLALIILSIPFLVLYNKKSVSSQV